MIPEVKESRLRQPIKWQAFLLILDSYIFYLYLLTSDIQWIECGVLLWCGTSGPNRLIWFQFSSYCLGFFLTLLSDLGVFWIHFSLLFYIPWKERWLAPGNSTRLRIPLPEWMKVKTCVIRWLSGFLFENWEITLIPTSLICDRYSLSHSILSYLWMIDYRSRESGQLSDMRKINTSKEWTQNRCHSSFG